MLELIKQYLLDNWREIFPERQRPEKLYFLLSGEKAYRNKTALVFCDDDPMPVLIAKIARRESGADFLEKEFTSLKRAQEVFESVEAEMIIPRPFVYSDFGPDKVLIETAVPGETLESKWGRLGKRAWMEEISSNLPKITEALIELEKHLTSGTSKINIAEFAEKTWKRFYDAYSPSESERELFGQIIDCDFMAEKADVNSIWSHGDFWIGNILETSSGGLGLIDWEQTQDHGLPFWDLFFFITTATLFSPHGRWGKQPLRGLETCLSENSPVLDLFRQAINRMNSELDMPLDDVSFLFRLFLLDMATFNHQRIGMVKEQDDVFRRFLSKDIGII